MNIWEYFASFDEAFRELNFVRVVYWEERIDNDVELLVQLIRNENG